MNTPELLLPVGNKEMLMAAIANKADAVYFGVPHFNARGRTVDFTLKDVQEMIDTARLYGVKSYLALNILIFEKELELLFDYLIDIIKLKPDAFIIQDIGLARLIKQIAKEQEIHASTQMSISSAEGVNAVKNLGFSRVVLARELSIQNIQSIKENTDLELEIFVHGALCVSYSGQCLTSENFGGRSGNRGQCAQSCRLPYKIFVDGKEFKNRNPYIFSPHDLSALSVLKELKNTDVESYKVEGRLKTPEYVAAVTKAYKTVLENKEVPHYLHSALQTLFSRGLSPGWLKGINHRNLVDGKFSNHHGEFLGKIHKVENRAFTIRLENKVKDFLPFPGDGIFIEPLNIGGRIFKTDLENNFLKIELENDFPYAKLKSGNFVYKNDSPALEKELKKTYSEKKALQIIPVFVHLEVFPGKNITFSLKDTDGNSVSVQGGVLKLKENVTDRIFVAEKELKAFGNTPYFPLKVTSEISENLFIQNKDIRLLRQKAVLELNQKRINNTKNIVIEKAKAKIFYEKEKEFLKENSEKKAPELSVLVRNPKQIDALKNLNIHTVYMDFDWGVSYDDSIKKIHSLGFAAGIATLRIHKPGESHYFRKILKLAPESVLIRNLAALDFFKNTSLELIGDYTLNISNTLSASYFIKQGLKTIHPSLDLNAKELLNLIQYTGSKTEIALHQYLPAFHADYCVFSNFLAKADRFPECKKYCTEHSIEILDHKGKKHFLTSDAECRNTLFLGTPRSSLRLLPELKKYDVSAFRLEMLNDTPELVYKKTKLYLDAITEKISLQTAIRSIGAEEKYGVSEGQLFNDTVWKNKKKSILK